jgi:hypothetical protein
MAARQDDERPGSSPPPAAPLPPPFPVAGRRRRAARTWRGRVTRGGRRGMSREERGDPVLPSRLRARQNASHVCVLCWRLFCDAKTLCATQNEFGLHCWSQSHMIFIRPCLGISGMNGNEGHWGGGISTISQNFPKSPSILFHPLESSISQTSP